MNTQNPRLVFSLLSTVSLLFVSMIAAADSTETIAQPPAGKYFDRVVFVLFENTNYSSAIKQPFFKKLATEGADLANFLALTHPSQGNYIALTSGDLNGITDDRSKTIDVENVADLLERKGLSWKVYAEDYPGNCFTGGFSNGYARKHNPFISYLNIQKNPARCARIVNAAEFSRDVANGSLPNYSFYIPDEKNDGHDTGVAYADRWYRKTFTPFISNPDFMKNTVLISTFDESAGDRRNQIYTSIYGAAVKPGSYTNALTIPSLLKLVEENWALGSLNKLDSKANPIPNVWQ